MLSAAERASLAPENREINADIIRTHQVSVRLLFTVQRFPHTNEPGDQDNVTGDELVCDAFRNVEDEQIIIRSSAGPRSADDRHGNRRCGSRAPDLRPVHIHSDGRERPGEVLSRRAHHEHTGIDEIRSRGCLLSDFQPLRGSSPVPQQQKRVGGVDDWRARNKHTGRAGGVQPGNRRTAGDLAGRI